MKTEYEHALIRNVFREQTNLEGTKKRYQIYIYINIYDIYVFKNQYQAYKVLVWVSILTVYYMNPRLF